MPLKDFLNSQQVNTPVKPTGSLANYLNGSSQPMNAPLVSPSSTANSTPAVAPKGTQDTGDAFRWIGKQLSKPQGVVVKEMKAVGEGIGDIIAGNKGAGKRFVKTQKEALDVLTGKEQTSFSKELEKAGAIKTKTDKAVAFVGDLFVDPLWVIKPVKIVKAIGEATKLDVPAVKLAEFLKSTPVGENLKKWFSTSSGNKEFDTIVNTFRDLKQYREGKIMDEAVALQKDIKKLAPGSEEIITEGLENPESLKTITDPKTLDIINNLKKTYSDFLNKTKEVGLSVGEIENYAPHIRTAETFLNGLKKQFSTGAREFGTAGVEKGRQLAGTIKELGEQGINIFEKNPAIQLAKKGTAYTKAITSKEFADAVSRFAVKEGVPVTNPLLKGLKFAPNEARVIDNYYQAIKPEELNVILKGFDKIQNIWKAQALVSPSYHVRNVAGNLWNNFLAGVNPAMYGKASLLQTGRLKNPELIDEARKLGVLNEGWYAADIADEIANRVAGIKNWKKGLNPLSQQNYGFKLNKWIGSGVENNARLAHYLSKLEQGLSPVEAAASVKKYLFDYSNLTNVEKNIFKRVIPFYTWTRKNLPIQLESLINQPAKMQLPQKLIDFIESGVDKPEEKYMSHYIGENIPVRIRKNKDGNTEYFLLGNWLPYASAIDLLSKPLDNLVAMITPAIKTPYEYLSNQSTMFKNTLGEPSKIEQYKGQPGEFLGMSIRQKNIQLLRNIRVLNDMNKWFDKQDPTAVKDSLVAKIFNTFFGKTQTYDVGKAKYFYDKDTQDRIDEYKRAIKTNQKRGFDEEARKIQEEMREFIRSRQQ